MAYETSAVPNESVLALRRRAVWFFRAVLVAFTLASIAGNTLHAVMQHYANDVSTFLAAGVAMVAPIVLLIMTEVLSLSNKCRLPQASAYYVALTSTLAVEVIAFLMSFDALRDLAGRNGVRPGLAWFWPLLIDIPAAIAAMWLLLLSRAASRVIPMRSDDAVELSTSSIDDGEDRAQEDDRDDGRVVAIVGPQRELATGHAKAAGETDHHNDRAVHAVVASKRTKQPPEVVRAILERHANGKKTNDICDEFGLHHSTVSRIIATAIDRRTAVG
jgi:hypothetical protein